MPAVSGLLIGVTTPFCPTISIKSRLQIDWSKECFYKTVFYAQSMDTVYYEQSNYRCVLDKRTSFIWSFSHCTEEFLKLQPFIVTSDWWETAKHQNAEEQAKCRGQSALNYIEDRF